MNAAIEVTPQNIEETMNNPYAMNGYIFTKSGEVYSPEDFDYVWEMYGENVCYAIHWEGEDLHTEDGKTIESAYGLTE
jgi:hypothetical protein